MDNEDVKSAKEWFQYAKTDYGVAEHLFGNYHPRPLEIICFHCQQAVEKCLKAIIVLHGKQGGMPKKIEALRIAKEVIEWADGIIERNGSEK